MDGQGRGWNLEIMQVNGLEDGLEESKQDKTETENRVKLEQKHIQNLTAKTTTSTDKEKHRLQEKHFSPSLTAMLLLLYVHVCVTRTGWKTRPRPKTVILLIKQSINQSINRCWLQSPFTKESNVQIFTN